MRRHYIGRLPSWVFLGEILYHVGPVPFNVFWRLREWQPTRHR